MVRASWKHVKINTMYNLWKISKHFFSLCLSSFLLMVKVKIEAYIYSNDFGCFPSSVLPSGKENSRTALNYWLPKLQHCELRILFVRPLLIPTSGHCFVFQLLDVWTGKRYGYPHLCSSILQKSFGK